jgi:hypothetical protein
MAWKVAEVYGQSLEGGDDEDEEEEEEEEEEVESEEDRRLDLELDLDLDCDMCDDQGGDVYAWIARAVDDLRAPLERLQASQRATLEIRVEVEEWARSQEAVLEQLRAAGR